MKYIFDETKNVVRKVKEGYWIRTPAKWWRNDLHGLRPIERCLLISLRVWGHLRPSTNKLAKELGITWRTADKGLKILRKKGFLPSAF
jgi:hypothetical protein